MPNITTLRATWVLPINSPPIQNGEVLFEDDKIIEVRAYSRYSSKSDEATVLNFGPAVIMPGLVNVHTHLDYTVMRGFLEDVDFFPWIRELNATKAALDHDDWVASAVVGAAEAVAGGVTTIGDCTATGAALVGAMTVGLRAIIYQEVFGIDPAKPVENIITELEILLDQLKRIAGPLQQIGISPHAPYTVRPDLFRALREYLNVNPMPVCIHAAESLAETELIRDGRGVIRDMLDRREITWTESGGSTVKYLSDLGMLGEEILLVHGVQFTASDMELIRASKTPWAHCPKSNAKLGNGVAPLNLMQSCYEVASSRIGIGSDSVASNNTMDLFEEMRFAVLIQRAHRSAYDALTAKQAVDMATIGGARALRMDDKIGSLTPGKQADIAVVSLKSLATTPVFDPYSALVYSASARDVVQTIIAGETVYIPGEMSNVIYKAIDTTRLAANKLTTFRKQAEHV